MRSDRVTRVMAGRPEQGARDSAAESSPGETRFVPKPATKWLLHPAFASAHPRRILVVDNFPDVADTLAKILDLMGHEARAVYGGADALALGAAFHPHLVLLDLGMPGMDGYEVCRQLRLRSWGRDILVVAMTCYAGTQELHEAFQAGFDCHLAKPFELDEIRRILALVE